MGKGGNHSCCLTPTRITMTGPLTPTGMRFCPKCSTVGASCPTERPIRPDRPILAESQSSSGTKIFGQGVISTPMTSLLLW